MAFTVPAVGVLAAALLRKNIGGSDRENSAPILEEESPIQDKAAVSSGWRKAAAYSMGICLTLIALLTVVTLLIASSGASGSGKCPLGF